MLRQKRFVFGGIITLAVALFALFGPFFAPHGENEVVGPPYTSQGVFGTDYLGQDVLSRLMYGGTEILIIALLATVLSTVFGTLIGVVAAYGGGWWDEVIMRLNDVLLSFPQILLALVVLTSIAQPKAWMLVVLVGLSNAPRTARIARGVALGLVSRDFVHAAEALGERRSRVIVAEVLPNMNAPLLAEAGLRLTFSIGLVAALGFLGITTDPSAANWGQMINENRLGLATQAWAVLAPVLVIGLFTIGTNLTADGIAQVNERGGDDSMSAPAQEPTATRTTSGIAIEDLRIGLTARPGVDVVDDIDLVLRPGEVVGLVGESGSGKTTVGTALLGYTRAGAAIERGKILFEDKDVLGLPWQQVRQLRGEEIAYVPQDPASALNPSIRIGRQIVELMELRGLGTAESRLQGARDGLAEVGLPNDDEFLRRYSHQLSGGQVQRVALAMAFLPKPKVLVLDEPTTGLDVTTQGMVLQTMGELCRTHGVAALYVTHDLAVIANIADRVAVMYAGQIAELGDRDDDLRPTPRTPTRGRCWTRSPTSARRARSAASPVAPRPPAPVPSGCRFNDRCEFAIDECRAGRARAPRRRARAQRALHPDE